MAFPLNPTPGDTTTLDGRYWTYSGDVESWWYWGVDSNTGAHIKIYANSITNATGAPGPQGPPGADGADGVDGVDGLGWTGGSYDPLTGVVTFTSDDGLGFVTGDLRGADGADGVDGVDGAVGPQGPEGPQGLQGDTGPQGPQGLQGEQGLQGPQGLPGADGADGAQGPQGIQGEQGLQGPQGLPGADGADSTVPGPQGPKGDKGDTGDAGPQGPKGDTGDAGPQGLKGDPGNDGADGATGPEGPQGPQGNPGADGADGAQGPKGDKGDTGDPGAQGPQGNPGDQGPQGNPGADGADGAIGPEGPQGPQGPEGPEGPMSTAALTVDINSDIASASRAIIYAPGSNGQASLKYNGSFLINPLNGTLTAPTFIGDLTGDVSVATISSSGSNIGVTPTGNLTMTVGNHIIVGAGNQLRLLKKDGSNRVALNMENITANRTVSFPDKGGTIAMTSDLGSGFTPAFITVTNSTAQSIQDTMQDVVFNSTEVSQGMTLTGGKVRIDTAGTYVIHVIWYGYQTSGNNRMDIQTILQLNGSTIANSRLATYTRDSTYDTGGCGGSTIGTFSVNDLISLQCQKTPNVLGSIQARLSLHRIA
ncbi:hypothetical protein P60_gp48 [Synechococcus phage P60]|uniref:Collagen triple helix repeat containing protein n=1 Tax=Synechococcus phage P60 TaxID=2905923 RepID=L0CQP2_9CAUD|nr:hypothetical protein P60_gp48 [Synechococcus phage P60]AGA17900.1 hypothetical protein P60_gp48 [Synechococcus phage P60]